MSVLCPRNSRQKFSHSGALSSDCCFLCYKKIFIWWHPLGDSWYCLLCIWGIQKALAHIYVFKSFTCFVSHQMECFWFNIYFSCPFCLGFCRECVRCGSGSYLLPWYHQFLQHHFWRGCLSPVYVLCPCPKSSGQRCLGLFLYCKFYYDQHVCFCIGTIIYLLL